MRVGHFDCFSGISGDMVLGAFLDAGLPLEGLRAALGSLAVGGYTVDAERVLRAGVSATRFRVREGSSDILPTERPPRAELSRTTQPDAHAHAHASAPGRMHSHDSGDAGGHTHSRGDEQGAAGEQLHGATRGDAVAESGYGKPHSPAHRSLPEVGNLIDRSALSPSGRARAKAMFQRLAEAEARIHQMPVEHVHLHEVGELDSIIDIVGAVFAMEWAAADRVVCSPLNVGSGVVQSAHGLLPVPAPATLALLGDAPVYGGTVPKEMVTPTGALIATTYAQAFGSLPAMSIERIGYGAGGRDNAGTPNVLRVVIGRAADSSSVAERVAVIECEIDDMNPQLFAVIVGCSAWKKSMPPSE